MSDAALRSLITQALVDTQLCSKLLNGGRELVLAQYELSEVERAVLRTIEADSLQAFAAQVDDWMQRNQHQSQSPFLSERRVPVWHLVRGDGSHS